METVAAPLEAQKKKQPKLGRIKKLDQDAAKILVSLKDKANKKTFGRKVKESEILALGLSLIESKHLERLQEATLSETDRLKIAHEEFQKKNGKLTLDQFIGKLLKQGLNN